MDESRAPQAAGRAAIAVNGHLIPQVKGRPRGSVHAHVGHGPGDMGIKLVAESCGYQDLASFTRTFRKRAGVSPGQYRKMNATRSAILKP
jgi:AraC-like DNA-binding protein